MVVDLGQRGDHAEKGTESLGEWHRVGLGLGSQQPGRSLLRVGLARRLAARSHAWPRAGQGPQEETSAHELWSPRAVGSALRAVRRSGRAHGVAKNSSSQKKKGLSIWAKTCPNFLRKVVNFKNWHSSKPVLENCYFSKQFYKICYFWKIIL